jgi:putative ABC transport system permease protein
VEAAGATSRRPLAGYRWTGDLFIEDKPEVWGRELRHKEATPGYFEAMGIPVLKGRTFTWADGQNAPRVVVVNEALAREFFPGEDPVGRRITYSRGSGEPRWTTIIAVVGNERQDGLGASVRPEVFDAQMQSPANEMTLVVRAGAPSAALAADARAAVAAIDPELAIYDIETMAEVVSGSVARERFTTALVGAFAALALALASVGLYGLMAFAVGARTREIGVRMALGARRAEVVGMVLGEGVRLVLVGLVAGLAAAAALAGLLSSLLYDVAPTDLPTYAGVAAIFLVVAIVAAAVPARRAARVDPLVALRNE